MTKRRWVVYGIVGVMIVGTVLALQQPAFAPYESNIQQVSLRGQTFFLEIAKTQAEREKGLSSRGHIAADGGMLFVFDSADTYCFWMKDTLVPLDMLWFDENYRVIHRAQSVQPDSYPTSFCPPRKAKYVVELPAGTVERLNVQLDDVLSLL